MPAPAPTRLPLVLLTGFDAFGGASVNPSGLAVQVLEGEVIEGHRVHALQLPTVFGVSEDMLLQALSKHRPALVIAVGVAHGRSGLSLEQVAINWCDASIPDNAGAQPQGNPVLPGGPNAYFSSLPVKAICQALLQAGIPAQVSLSAGSYVCNHVFYGLMHSLANKRKGWCKNARGGFIHVPSLPEQALAGAPCLPLVRQIQGLRLAVQTALQCPTA
ncbi:MAG: pyroglutamyl-peptidase I [Burkholderiaceae bacterium]